MRRPPSRGRIQPKVSTMPRQKSEAAAFLDIYKLVVEKKRLQQELESLDQRRQQIHGRLAVLDRQVSDLEYTVEKLRAADPDLSITPELLTKAYEGKLPEGFETLFLDY